MATTTIGLSAALRQGQVTAVKDAADFAATAGKLYGFSGTRPATGGATTTQLFCVILNDPCGTVSGQTLTFDIDPLPQDTGADATGTATWWRGLPWHF